MQFYFYKFGKYKNLKFETLKKTFTIAVAHGRDSFNGPGCREEGRNYQDPVRTGLFTEYVGIMGHR